MKKIVLICTLAVILFVAFFWYLPMEVQAATVDSGTCGANLTWTLDEMGTLTISGTGDTSDASWDDKKIKNIIIQEGVTGVGNGTFEDCSNIVHVELPNSLVRIGDYAFADCQALKSIIIPNNVISIGDWAFSYCYSLSSIVIPDSVADIGVYAFICCRSLTSIVIPNNVTVIRNGTFSNCTSLVSVTIPDSVVSIVLSAFARCSSLTSITIPQNVTSIGHSVFSGCSSLTSVVLPKSLKEIDDYAFEDCDSIKHVIYTGTHAQWSAISIGGKNGDLTGATRHYEVNGDEIITKNSLLYCLLCNSYLQDCLEHSYGSWNKIDDYSHKRSCTVCHKEDMQNHTWNSGNVNQLPTCKETGVKTYTCSGCNATKTEAIEKLATHTPGPAATATKDQTCIVCGEVLAAATGETETTPPATEPPATEPPATSVTTEPPTTEPPTAPTESAPDPSGTDATQPGNTGTTPGEPAENETDNMIIIVIVACASCLLIGAGGVAVGIVIGKKKR